MAQKVDRLTRVNSLLKQVIADILSKDSFFPPGVLVSITEVKCSTDLKNAKIKVSFLGGKASTRNEALKELEARKVDMQHKIAKDLGFKHTPVLTFEIDRRIEAGDRVLAIIEEESRKNGNN